MSRALAPYAAVDARSRGRRHAEPPPRLRSEFQRDRDRIVHSAAFRRLEYKTQVFVNHEGDMLRTRLTHSLEVAQIGRSVARALGLNEDLTEAIALAHDLGHTPFGHAGQDALNECMAPWGGFEHNLQSLRVVDELEERYAEFPGLNLTFETREGILKHCDPERAAGLGELGERFLAGHQPSLEAQLANVADEIAYNNHDLDDGLRSGLLDLAVVAEVPLVGSHLQAVRDRYPGIGERRLVHETIRRLIDTQVNDLVEATRTRLRAAAPRDIDDVRRQPAPLVGFSDEHLRRHLELKGFLHRHLYRHYRVCRMASKARRIVRDLFRALFEEPALLPPTVQAQITADGGGDEATARRVADYVAGMTDRYAIAEHRRIYDPGALS